MGDRCYRCGRTGGLLGLLPGCTPVLVCVNCYEAWKAAGRPVF
jgi:hypothetical protein